MKHSNIIGSSLLLLSLAACSQNSQVSNQQADLEATPTIINLTQVGCQFVEVEAKNYQYEPQEAEDCQEINSETLAKRKSGFKPLKLKPGKYIFRVTNSSVPYQLGFYLRGEGLKEVSLPNVSGGGLATGTTKDYEVDLIAGKYVFSCPLNPTPDYPVFVN